MGEITYLFRGKEVLNFKSWFYEDGLYVEEFDTSDGEHWIGTSTPEEYTPEIYELAIEEGIIQE